MASGSKNREKIEVIQALGCSDSCLAPQRPKSPVQLEYHTLGVAPAT